MIILAMVLAGFGAAAQHLPIYSQYLFNGMAINPAYTGSRDALSATVAYRNQWVGFDGAPITQTFNAHAPLKKKNIALGLCAYNDKIGVSRETGFFGNYAYRIKMGKGRFAMGLSGGMAMARSDWASVSTITSNDPVFMGNMPTFLLPNFGAGLYYYTDRFYAGLSVPRFLTFGKNLEAGKVNTRFDSKNVNAMATTGMQLQVSNNWQFYPSVLLKSLSGRTVQADINATAIYNDVLWGGVSYRHGDAIVGLLQYRMTSQLSLGYSYDYTLSDLNQYNSGTHEILLRYEFRYKIKAANPRFF